MNKLTITCFEPIYFEKTIEFFKEKNITLNKAECISKTGISYANTVYHEYEDRFYKTNFYLTILVEFKLVGSIYIYESELVEFFKKNNLNNFHINEIQYCSSF